MAGHRSAADLSMTSLTSPPDSQQPVYHNSYTAAAQHSPDYEFRPPPPPPQQQNYAYSGSGSMTSPYTYPGGGSGGGGGAGGSGGGAVGAYSYASASPQQTQSPTSQNNYFLHHTTTPPPPAQPQVKNQIPPGGAPARRYLNEKVTPVLLEGMKMLAREQPKEPLLVLARWLEEQHHAGVANAGNGNGGTGNVKVEGGA